MTGCEESGLLGVQSFLRSRDTSSWLFLNFDNVGGPATLRYLRREGVFRMWDADPGLVSVAASARRSAPRARALAHRLAGGPHLRRDAGAGARRAVR